MAAHRPARPNQPHAHPRTAPRLRHHLRGHGMSAKTSHRPPSAHSDRQGFCRHHLVKTPRPPHQNADRETPLTDRDRWHRLACGWPKDGYRNKAPRPMPPGFQTDCLAGYRWLRQFHAQSGWSKHHVHRQQAYARGLAASWFQNPARHQPFLLPSPWQQP